ncbi:MAG: Sir2 family NAD-dependent protein deacetylase [Verrucomicrobiota bacterium]
MKKLVAFTGSGISAPSGIKTFRDHGGLWDHYRIEDVATPEAWERNPQVVLDFYNLRREQLAEVEPNAGHQALVDLEDRFEVVVITQNVDDLHERAGSKRVLHLHGELRKVRSVLDETFIQDIGTRSIALGDCCPNGGQLRPHIVWFGEWVHQMEVAEAECRGADVFMVVGTSLSVFPAASLASTAPSSAEKFYIDPSEDALPPGFEWIAKSAEMGVPELTKLLLD